MIRESLTKLIGHVKAVFIRRKLVREGKRLHDEEFILPSNVDFCHKDKVHIIVRGLVDGRLHIVKNRNYTDVRLFSSGFLFFVLPNTISCFFFCFFPEPMKIYYDQIRISNGLFQFFKIAKFIMWSH